LSSGFPPDDPELFTAKNDLALMLEDDNEKEPLFREALAGQIRVRGVESIEAAETQHNLADFLRHGKPDEAEPLLRQALATFEKLLGPFHWRDLMTQKTLSRLLLANNKTEEGRAVLMDCVAKSEQHFPNSPDTAQIYDDLIDVLLKEGSLDEVAKYTRLAMGIYQQLGMEHPNTLRALNNYGYSLRKAGRIADAEQFDRHSSEASFRVLGENHPLTLHRRNNLVLTLSLLGRLGEAREILNQNIAAKPEPYENLTPRIFLLQSVVETLACPDGSPADHRSVTQPLGRLKTHLSRKPLPVCSGIAVPWDVRYFWENLRGKVAGDMVGLFESLVTVLNQRCASDPSAACPYLPPEISPCGLPCVISS
jgi:tetratricopeptide (TPR) repeat protein